MEFFRILRVISGHTPAYVRSLGMVFDDEGTAATARRPSAAKIIPEDPRFRLTCDQSRIVTC